MPAGLDQNVMAMSQLPNQASVSLESVATCAALQFNKKDICKKCQGEFAESPFLRAAIKLGAEDMLGNTILEIYYFGEDYTIYRSSRGVFVQCSDCQERKRVQRERYVKIAEPLCQLRYLTSQMAGRFFSGKRSPASYYDHQIVQAIVLALWDETPRANQLLSAVLDMAHARVTNENRVRYLLACLLTGLVLSFVLIVPAQHLPPISAALPFLLAGIFGAVGAVFSIAMRVQHLQLVPCRESVMNVVMGALRVLVGSLSGAIGALLLKGTVLGTTVASLFVNPMAMDLSLGKDGTAWIYVALVGLLGGFAERLVPNMLQAANSQFDPARQTGEDSGSSSRERRS